MTDRRNITVLVLFLSALSLFQFSAAHIGPAYSQLHFLSSVILGILINWIIFKTNWLKNDDKSFFIFLLLTSFSVFFRRELFYNLDEFDVITQFSEQGSRAIFHMHNEHFMPLFFLIYFFQTKLFGISYGSLVVISTLLHAITAFLVYRFLCLLSISSGKHFQIRVLALFWMLSSVHIEVLNWPFTQQSIVSEIAAILAMMSALKFLRNTRPVSLFFFVILSVAAGLSFGNGIRLPLIISGLILFELFSPLGRRSDQQFSFFHFILRGALLFTFSTLISIGVYSLYRHQAEAASLNIATAIPFSELVLNYDKSLSYIYVGTQLGSVLRGLALYLSLDLTVPDMTAPEWITSYLNTEMAFANTGAFVSLILFFILYRLGAIRFWFLGQLICAGGVLLPSLARWELGIFQSLALRYQYHSMLGVTVMMLPLLVSTFYNKKTHFYYKSVGRFILPILLVYFLSSQLYLISNFDYFTTQGRELRSYVNKLRNYKELTADGVNTEPPPRPGGLTVWMTESYVYNVMHYLDRKQFPDYTKHSKNDQ
jgi:hypothetical protein